MCFDYDPKDANNTIDEGEYDASIKAVQDKAENGEPLTSRKGEPMICVTFEVYTTERARTLRQYFTAKSGLWRYRELAHALGQAEAFTDKKFHASNHVGDGLVLVLGIEDRPNYGPQNTVEEFKPKAVGTPPRAAISMEDRAKLGKASASPLQADDIPF